MEDLKRGDLIQVNWVDIQEDPVGDPDKARLPLRISFGIFWNKTPEALITTSTIDEGENSTQSGYCIYPLGCVQKVVKIKGRGRRKKNGTPKRPGITVSTGD